VTTVRLIFSKKSFDLGGIKMKKRFLTTVLGLTMGSALLFSACGSKKETTQTTQAAAETTAKAEESSSEETTTVASVKVDINYDIANHLDESYDDVVGAFGTPVSDEKAEGGEKLVKYADPERVFHYYDDKSGGYVLEAVSAKAGDLLSFTDDGVKLDDILDQMEGEKATGLDSNEAYLTVGVKGDSNVVFQSEGYYFIVSLGKDGMVSKDSAVAIVTEDRAGVDTAGETKKAPSEIKTVETTEAKK
jgi:hypothetical protein